MNTVRNIVLAAGPVAAIVVAAAGTATADPTPPPSPGYQIPGPDGPTFPGTQVYSPLVCAQHAGLRAQVQPWHRDMAAGNRIDLVAV
jgi:hypothetical protein